MIGVAVDARMQALRRERIRSSTRRRSRLKNPAFLRLRRLLGASPPSGRDPEDPIRSELFSIERLEQHAETLAVAQRGAVLAPGDRRLAKRVTDNGRVLLAAYRTIGNAIREERAIT